MGLLSRKLGLWAGGVVAAVVLSAIAPSAEAGPAAKPAPHHGHRSVGKRAVASEKKVERARTGKNLPAAWSTPARDPKMGQKTVPVAHKEDADKASPKDADKASPKDADKPSVKEVNKAPSKEGVKPGVKVVGKAGDKLVAKNEPKVPASSVGSPNEGHLVGGVKLDTSDGTVRVVPAYQRGDTRWGLPALIHMLERSAKKVAKKNPGAVLGVGDISRKNGGDIFLHRSHESGRDADIAFYVLDHKGKNLLPDTFVQFQGSVESTSMPGARFDVAKNWALVQAMLEDPVARVSHIFVADPLRRMLLAHAKSRVSPAMYNRAAQVMMQPSNALPHDNHFHVRISCPAEMKKSCVEYPVGVFAKKQKGKPSLITPRHKHGSDKAVAGADKGSAKSVARADKASPKAGVQAHAAVSKPVAKPVARKMAQVVTPKRPAKPSQPDSKVASNEPKKKPIYLQAAAANNDDPLDTVLFSLPALSHLNGADPEGDADGEDVKASVDETGTVRITD